jgi:hypothetical protein
MFMEHNMKQTILIFAMVLTMTSILLAQKVENSSTFGVETDILWPFFPGLTRTQATITLWQDGDLKGDLLVGVNSFFPDDRETEGRFSEYSIVTGYRQYLWQGLHVEFSQSTGMGVLDNHVTTGKSYKSYDWAVTGYIGYKFELAEFNPTSVIKSLYIIPQFGVERVIYKSNPWPIYEDKTLTKEVGERPMMLGSLRFGCTF